MEQEKQSQMFISLVLSLQMQGMIHLGKIVNPMDGSSEKDLEAAQATIDMLDMLLNKTSGNLSDYERKSLEHVVSDLKLNFVDEKGKQEKSEPIQENKAKEPSASEEKTEESETGKDTSEQTKAESEDNKEETDKKEN